MGYETRLIIGRAGTPSDEIKTGELTISDGEAYRPYLKDEFGRYIKTGRTEVYFMEYASIDLCKCGYDSEISKIDWKNTDKNIFWYYYGSDGNTPIIEDCYGGKSEPVPIKDVIAALEKDVESSEYRRFKWALALLKSMDDDSEELTVMFYGH